MTDIVLRCHPATPSSAVRSVRVQLRSQADALTLAYVIEADAAALVIPEIGAAQRSDELWRHSCFELFAAGVGGSYREMNFSPSSAWAIYDFTDTRIGMTNATIETAPRITRDSQGLHCHVTVPAALLLGTRRGPESLALAAVVEERPSRLSYWAVRHPSAAPDFHHRGGFCVSWPVRGIAAEKSK